MYTWITPELAHPSITLVYHFVIITSGFPVVRLSETVVTHLELIVPLCHALGGHERWPIQISSDTDCPLWGFCVFSAVSSCECHYSTLK
jgi:hypothetical protein